MWRSLECWLYWLMGTEEPLNLSPWAKGLRQQSRDEAHFSFVLLPAAIWAWLKGHLAVYQDTRDSVCAQIQHMIMA